MAEQFTLNLPDGLAKQVREVAALTQRGLEDVLLDWLDRGSAAQPSRTRAEPSEAELLQRVNLGFSADWWATYRGLIVERQLVGMSEALEQANVPRIEALGQLAELRGCTIEEVMASLGIGLGIDG
jgi:hypothetical protein